MTKKIQILILFICITGSSLFAQVNTTIQNPKVYVSEMTKEQRADQINKERTKQAEINKSEAPTGEKNAVIINENKINPAVIKESQSNIKLLKIESKEILLNKTEIEKVKLIESSKPGKK